MLGIIETGIVLLLIITVLVVAHEWGHFIVARLCGIRVDDFSIGMGKRLVRLGKLGDTEYNIRILPIGGFVKIAGMEADEEPLVRAKDAVVGKTGKNTDEVNTSDVMSDDPDANEIPLIAENTPEKTPYTGEDGFYAKPLWRRSLVILAGPVASLVTGWLIFCVMGFTTGIPTGKILNRVAYVDPDKPAFKMGLQSGDYITAINGQSITTGEQMLESINNSPNVPLAVTVKRDGKELLLHGTPKLALDDKTHQPRMATDVVTPGPLGAAMNLQPGDRVELIDGDPTNTKADIEKGLTRAAGKKITIIVSRHTEDQELTGMIPTTIAESMPVLHEHVVGGQLGFGPDSQVKRYPFHEAIAHGTELTGVFFMMLWQMVKDHTLHKNAGGIIRIAAATDSARKLGFVQTAMLTAQISLSLALFNILPIPILDGGHLATFFVEWIRGGRRLTPEQQMNVLYAGLAVIVVLALLVNGHDLLDLIHHKISH